MKRVMKFVSVFVLIGMMVPTLYGQKRMTRAEYINKYKALAVEEMDLYGIPASVKLAQALLESDDGNSRLAREGNNHFGIKCKSNWRGETIAHTDDAPDECFRKYPSVEASYHDHSEFLDQSERYQSLFELDPTDYRGWAKGLQKAGYATNPRYADLLIGIIEDEKLYLLDEGQDLPEKETVADEVQSQTVEIPAATDVIDVDNYAVSVLGQNGKHTVYRNNGSLFILVQNGDTPESIAAETKVSVKKLTRYNDLQPNATVKPGDMLYIRPKGKRSANGKVIHVAKSGETLHSISQMYGIRLKNLCKINRRDAQSPVTEGQQIRLM